MDLENLHGPMAKIIQANMLKIKNKEEEDSTMEMGHFMKETGIKEDNTERENSDLNWAKRMKEDMNMVNQSHERFIH